MIYAGRCKKNYLSFCCSEVVFIDAMVNAEKHKVLQNGEIFPDVKAATSLKGRRVNVLSG